MPEYGDIIYKPQAIYVATLNTDNTYGTPAKVEYAQSFEWEGETDEDTIKASGVNVEHLSVLIGASGSISEASLDWDVWPIVTGYTNSESGASGNLISDMTVSGGGDGLPYFGLIAVYTALNNGRHTIGFGKAKLSTIPAYSVEQNAFRTAEIDWMAVAATEAAGKILRAKKYEDSTDLPDFTTSAGFDNYLGGLFS